VAEKNLKKSLRANLRRARNAIPAALRQRNDRTICARLAADSEVSAFPQVFFYAALNAEPDLSALAARWFTTKRLALPVVEGKKLVFCRWQRGDVLVQGEFNVPAPTARQAVTGDRDTLVLLPCLALDRYGNRLGYGGGYYDRFLASHPMSCSVGVCYHRFWSETELPTDPHDRRVNYIVTERGLYAAESHQPIKSRQPIKNRQRNSGEGRN